MAARVVVVGGGSGLGRLWARRHAEAGDTVVIADVSDEGMAETASSHAQIRAIRCDITRPADVRELFVMAGTIDRLILTAAIMPTSLAVEDSFERIERVMEINYLGNLRVIRAALSQMLPADRGEIIVLGSVVAEAPTPHMSAYAASKAALNVYVEILQHELLDSGVSIRLVLPPMTDTPLINQARETSNPRSMVLGFERGIVARPEDIVSHAERAAARGRSRIYPHRMSWALHLARRFAPRLLWWTILQAEKDR